MGDKVGMHNAMEFHSKRAITSLFSILEACQIEASEGSLERTVVDNFQIKVLSDSIFHSLRSLYAIAWDLTQAQLLNSIQSISPTLLRHNQTLEAIVKGQRQ
ncbi:conserved Plasmodium protein, unknown function [Babesia microti strain RI]|uniref:Uncharacterized protein n=1 Tax=Babesia microti (strain RI) TaxID=1133968 RepID=A0A1N6LWU1_BABMR|nr:conserved Plasmodium protein, unknown function [Babesia microti strain RI]SIO73336.1 conserved Plasmodium protein, unknown function [Babesia microti strain RI]|eukprot:XP_021337438.1 conserved Plasmodium protein, unknown function [Babesia microti strain RI]